MTAKNYSEAALEIDEGSWVYLSGTETTAASGAGLRRQVVKACEESGWLTFSCSIEERVGRGSDPGRFFETMRHAVEHADVVVTLIGEETEMSDAELALAYSHGRPVIGVQMDGLRDVGIQAMLGEYEHARVITCESAEECAASLRATFSDPIFAETIRQAQ